MRITTTSATTERGWGNSCDRFGNGERFCRYGYRIPVSLVALIRPRPQFSSASLLRDGSVKRQHSCHAHWILFIICSAGSSSGSKRIRSLFVEAYSWSDICAMHKVSSPGISEAKVACDGLSVHAFSFSIVRQFVAEFDVSHILTTSVWSSWMLRVQDTFSWQCLCHCINGMVRGIQRLPVSNLMYRHYVMLSATLSQEQLGHTHPCVSLWGNMAYHQYPSANCALENVRHVSNSASNSFWAKKGNFPGQV